MAAYAHDAAAVAIKGGSPMLNFPELAHSFPHPASFSLPDIKAASSMTSVSSSAVAAAHAHDAAVLFIKGGSPILNFPELAHTLHYHASSSLGDVKAAVSMTSVSASAVMTAHAHDAAAFAVKGSSAILNFPKLAPSLPCPASSSLSDIKAAASMTSVSASAGTAKPSPLDTFSPPNSAPRTSSSCSLPLSSSSCANNVSALEELGEMLGNILELPRLGDNFGFKPMMMSDDMNNLVYVDDMWVYPSEAYGQDYHYFGDQMNTDGEGYWRSF